MAARAVIRQGDKTDHDGIVLEGSNGDIVDGRAMATMGHQVYCPKCKKTTNIIEGSSDFILSNGKGVALEGMHTSCGAILLASQSSFVVDWSPDLTPARASVTTPSVAQSSVVVSTTSQAYDLHFLLKDQKTGQIKSNVSYRITLETGESFIGVSDENGLTEKVFSDTPVMATIEAPYYGTTESASTCTDTCGC